MTEPRRSFLQAESGIQHMLLAPPHQHAQRQGLSGHTACLTSSWPLSQRHAKAVPADLAAAVPLSPTRWAPPQGYGEQRQRTQAPHLSSSPMWPRRSPIMPCSWASTGLGLSWMQYLTAVTATARLLPLCACRTGQQELSRSPGMR